MLLTMSPKQNSVGPKTQSKRKSAGPKPPSKRGGNGVEVKTKKAAYGAASTGGRPAPVDTKATGKGGGSRDTDPSPSDKGGSNRSESGKSSSTQSQIVSKSPTAKKTKSFFVGVNRNDVLCQEYGIARAWNVKSSANVAWNGHSISAMARDAAVLSILEKEARGKKELRVLDWYGSPRNYKFKGAVKGCDIVWICGPNVAIGGDASRTVANARMDLEPDWKFDVVIVQDVYQYGPKPTDRLGPDGVKEILKYSSSGHLYIIARMFNGAAGADVFGNGKAEMVWFRQGGLILASPEPRGQWYAPHPDINWVQLRTHGGVDSSELGHFGPYSLYRLAMTRPGAQALVGQQLPHGSVDFLYVRNPGVLNWMRHKLCQWLGTDMIRYPYYIGIAVDWLFGRAMSVHRATNTDLSPKFAVKVPYGTTLDAAIHTIKESIGRDEEMRHLMLRAPDQFLRVVSDTTKFVLYGSRAAEVCAYYDLRHGHHGLEDSLVKLRGTTPVKIAREWQTAGVLVGSGLALIVGASSAFGLYQQLKSGLGMLPLGVACGLLPTPYSGATCLAKYSDDDKKFLIQNMFKLYGGQAVMEELFGWWAPRTKLVGAIVELCIYIASGASPLDRIIPLVIHANNYMLCEYAGARGKALAMGIHVGWNAKCTFEYANMIVWPLECPKALPIDITSAACLKCAAWLIPGGILGYCLIGSATIRVDEGRWRVFRQLYSEGRLIEAGKTIVSPLPPGTTFPAYQSKLNVVDWPMRGKISVKVDGSPCSVNDALELLEEGKSSNVLYPVLVTNRLLWEPANTEKNLLVALVTRTHKDPFEGRTDEKERHRRWSEVGDRMVASGVFAGNSLVQFTLEESAALMGSRGARILAAGKTDEELGPINLKKSASLKWNETITVFKNISGTITMKPRPIINLDPIYHARMTSVSRSLSEHLHRCFNGGVIEIAGIPMRIHYASGYNQERLSAMAADFDGDITCIAVSGDDSAAYIPGIGHVEADQSVFDHSQDDGPIKYYGSKWMGQCDVPEDFIKMVHTCCSKGYHVKKNRLEVKGNAETQMATGITMTTNINSVDTIAPYVWFLTERAKRPTLTLAEAGYELGLTMKVFPREDFSQITFLKGWWRRDVSGENIWLPLPSAVLKLGKILRNPVEITKTVKHTRGERRVIHDTPEVAARKIAYCLARSYGTVPLDYPIFGAFLACLLRLGVDPGRSLGQLEESWKPKIECLVVIDRDEAMQAMIKRYNLEAEWIFEVEAAFNSVTSLPVYVEHVLFDHLCDVDY